MTPGPLQLGWFSTARGKGSRDLLAAVQDKISQGELNARIAFVFCSREPGESPQTDIFFEQVRGYGLPLVYFSYQKFKRTHGAASNGESLPQWRLDYDREVMKRLQGYQPGLCVLAGYMLVVGPEMCRRYDMINLHPAAPTGPAGTWQEVIWKLIETRATETGVMMHLVTPQLDRGPVVTYCTFSLRGAAFDEGWAEISGQSIEDVKCHGESHPLFKLIRKHGMAREFPLIIATIKAFSRGEIRITEKHPVDAGRRPIRGYDLSHEIDELVKKDLK
ncbi:MAG: formyltransferase family protein [Dehalococcoidales bacterium]|nr:formyltransferase family protein [Dehalococcoidales bacterium]